MNIGPVIMPKGGVGHNGFCGPGALSIIARINTAQAAALLREVSGRAAIRGVYDGHMRRALERRGYRVKPVGFEPGITLAGWLKANPLTQRGRRVFLIAAAHHYLVVQGRRGGCNQSGPGPLKDMKKRRGFVTSIMEVFPAMATVAASSAPTRAATPAAPKAPKPKAVRPLKTLEGAKEALRKALAERDAANAKAAHAARVLEVTRKALADKALRDAINAKGRDRKRSQALAKAWGITIDPERNAGGMSYWVFPPDGLYADEGEDPHEGARCCFAWSEVLHIVEDYAKAAKAKA